MQRALILTLGLLTAVSSAYAAEEEEFRWSRATLDLIESGDAARGKEVAKTQKCKKCHVVCR